MPAKSKAKHAKQKPPDPPLGVQWTILAAIAGIAAIGLFVSCAMLEWRVQESMTIHWYKSSDLTNQAFNPTKYGLYMISFNGGLSSEAWYRRASMICASIDAYAPMTTSLGLLFDQPCSGVCVSHFRTRCNVYKKFATIGYLLLGANVISGLLALVGVTWLVIFGKQLVLLQLLWLGTGIVDICAFLYWLFQTDQGFRQLTLESQYPYPSLGFAAYIGVTSACTLCGVGLLTMIVACVEDSEYWNQRREEVEDAILNDGPTGPFGEGSSPFSPFGPQAVRHAGPPGGLSAAMGGVQHGMAPPPRTMGPGGFQQGRPPMPPPFATAVMGGAGPQRWGQTGAPGGGFQHRQAR